MLCQSLMAHAYLLAHFLFTTRFVTRTMSSIVGNAMASKLAAYGIGTSAPHIRSGGASRSSCSHPQPHAQASSQGALDFKLSMSMQRSGAHKCLLVDDGDDLSTHA